MNTQANSAAGVDDISGMSDPDFLAERRSVRDALEAMAPGEPGYAGLAAEFARLDQEFLRRASLAWQH
jgi:hypothetical protein